MGEHEHGSDHEKLKIYLPHMLKHNKEHVDDMARWREKASHLGLDDVAKELDNVISHLNKTNECLESAIGKLDTSQTDI